MNGLGGTLMTTEADVLRKDLDRANARIAELQKECDRRNVWFKDAQKRADDNEGELYTLRDAVQYWLTECKRLKDQVEFWHKRSQDMLVAVESDYHDDGGEHGESYNDGWNLGYDQGMEAAKESLDDELRSLQDKRINNQCEADYYFGVQRARDIIAKELETLKEQLG